MDILSHLDPETTINMKAGDLKVIISKTKADAKDKYAELLDLCMIDINHREEISVCARIQLFMEGDDRFRNHKPEQILRLR
ncbi:MAG: hypothetical protein HRU21_09260 [Pseudomonadales bacterium]|nr:hypothetical protein [Pseudomonadales bacterium]